jgi:hypothetical protein
MYEMYIDRMKRFDIELMSNVINKNNESSFSELNMKSLSVFFESEFRKNR